MAKGLMMKRGSCVLLLSLAAVACVSAGQSKATSYEARRGVECHSVATCRRLLLEIDRDLAVTTDTAPLQRVRDEVQRQLADYEATEARQKAMDQRAEETRRAASEQRAEDERRKEADRMAREQEAREAAERVPPSPDEQRAIETERRRAERASLWVEKEVEACKADRPGKRCVGVTGITDQSDVILCEQDCHLVVEYLVEDLSNRAIDKCVARYVADSERRGRATAVCTPDFSQPYAQRLHVASCRDRCKEWATFLVAERREARAQAEAQGSSPAPPASASSSGRSPTQGTGR